MTARGVAAGWRSTSPSRSSPVVNFAIVSGKVRRGDEGVAGRHEQLGGERGVNGRRLVIGGPEIFHAKHLSLCASLLDSEQLADLGDGHFSTLLKHLCGGHDWVLFSG